MLLHTLTLCLRHALAVWFLCHFFASSQRNGERKDARTFPPGPPSAADAELPRRVVCIGKAFAIPFLFEICVKLGAWQVARIFAFVCCVRLPCWQFSVKLPTQNLNLLGSAKTLEVLSADSFRAYSGFQGACPLMPFLRLFFAARQRIGINFPLARAAGTV